MKYSIAAIEFLNTVPLVEYLHSLPAEEISLRFDLPSRLVGMLDAGAADVGLVPAVEILRGRTAGLIAGTGIACCGPADSVKLFFRGSLSGLTSISVDRASRSSAALLEVLFQEMFARVPGLEEIAPVPGAYPDDGEGVLVIGDRCFEFEKQLRSSNIPGLQEMDLGQAWWDLTELPFVFAAWAVSSAFLGNASSREVTELVQILNAARDYGQQHLEEISAREASRGRLGHKGEATPAAVAYYFQESLQYQLGEQEMAGLARFQELCIKHGLVPEAPFPTVLRG